MRKFQEVTHGMLKHPNVLTILPTRGTKYSAGNDFHAKTKLILPRFKVVIAWTDVKVFTNCDEYLQVSIRSGLGAKGIIIANAPGIIDHDYANNPKNDGNIGIELLNIGFDGDFIIEEGEKIAQGIFQRYAIADDDAARGDRVGGYGSTGKF